MNNSGAAQCIFSLPVHCKLYSSFFCKIKTMQINNAVAGDAAAQLMQKDEVLPD